VSRRDRLPRREDREEPGSEEPACAPVAMPILALQRTAANRALVQRLLYNENQKALALPATYADQRLPWDGERYLQNRPVKPADPKLIDLVTQNASVKEQLRQGMNLDALDAVRSLPDAALQSNVGALAEPNADQAVTAELSAVAVDRNRLMKHWTNTRYGDLASLDVSWVISSPNDFIAGKPDLGVAGESVRVQIRGEEQGKTYWEYMCVLIALIKADGYGMVNTLTRKAATTLQPAVQALNDHYIGEDVQFDDTSTRMRVMGDWGFKLIYAGNTPWADLPKHVELKRGGKYIVDIPGHTVQVELLRDMPKDGKTLTRPRQYFAPHSEEDNYDKDELALPVTYLWSK
jgi:hypothetical protein